MLSWWNPMLVDILTLFPKMFSGPFGESIIKRAQVEGPVTIRVHNLRDWAGNKHKTVDDRPFGGGVGMILMCQPIFDAVEDLKKQSTVEQSNNLTILLTPQGRLFNQETAQRLSKLKHIILICGHYEGVDERVSTHLVNEEISIGDYILTGGELPAMVVVDAIVRLIPGVLAKPEAIEAESFGTPPPPRLEFPQYTRPADFRGLTVPKVLLSGNHQEIERWRKEQTLQRTEERRPGLLKDLKKRFKD